VKTGGLEQDLQEAMDQFNSNAYSIMYGRNEDAVVTKNDFLALEGHLETTLGQFKDSIIRFLRSVEISGTRR
jgi:hypothetical protein